MRNLNRPVTCKEIVPVIKDLPTKKKNPTAPWFQYRILRELQRRANTYTFQNLPHNRNRTLPNSLWDYSYSDTEVTQRLKQEKATQKSHSWILIQKYLIKYWKPNSKNT